MVYVMQVNGQPAAVNMREMVWDEELARLAQRLSRNFYDICFQPTCTLGYNDCNNLVTTLAKRTGLKRKRGKMQHFSVPSILPKIRYI